MDNQDPEVLWFMGVLGFVLLGVIVFAIVISITCGLSGQFEPMLDTCHFLGGDKRRFS